MTFGHSLYPRYIRAIRSIDLMKKAGLKETKRAKIVVFMGARENQATSSLSIILPCAFNLLQQTIFYIFKVLNRNVLYEGHLESKERFAIKKYLLIIGKTKNMQVLSHTFTYFST
jgi:hypothetical protein